MIKSIASISPSVVVSSYSPPHIYGSNQSAGMVRYNTNTQNMEVYDGNSWQMISSGASVGLSTEAEDTLRWAREKKEAELQLKQRMERHPGLKDAWEKFQTMDILTREEDELR